MDGGADARVRRLVCGVAVLAVLLGFAAADSPPTAALRQLQHVLDRQSDALLAGDERAYLATFAPGAKNTPRLAFRNLTRLPLADWRLRLVDAAPSGRGGYTARAVLHQRLRGWDGGASRTAERLEFRRTAGGWALAGSAGSGIWTQGEVIQERGARSLVLGVGRPAAELRELAAAADRAVAEAERYWPRGWQRRVVLEVPRGLDGMGRLLGSEPELLRGVAAVTTGGTRGAEDPPERIVVNPEEYGQLSEEGREFVVAHETVHVAARDDTHPGTPMWLSEGLADWVAHRAAGTLPRAAAPELARAVGEGRAPHRLPTDADFRFDAGAETLAHAYEGAWLACRLLAERYGAERLLAVHAASRHGAGQALEDQLGLSRAEFTAEWRAYVARVLG
ncbi:hypothetical protein [Streptomyces xiaopingdaonensis]|uniref:hypothetical protein n=1 Tax=Streptomyces xiaopingdaonensis TaxID=1565415 RepID=UPI000314B4C6|nr:hypothetical protein [Streptomyces xiaopingdaonensis]